MSLARKAVQGAIWTISASIGSRAIGLVGTLAVTRFIAPAEYGQVMVAAVLVMTATQLSTLGIGQYIIAKPDCGPEYGFSATLIHLATGVVALAALLLFGAPLGPLLDAPRVAEFLPLLVLAAMVDRFNYVPERLLVRDLRFAPISAARTLGDLGYSALSVGLAAMGWGAMAIVWGNLARAVLRTGVLVGAAERHAWLGVRRFDRKASRRMLGFGLPLSLAAISNFATRRWDNLLVSGFFGPAAAGTYNLAYNLADVPAIQVGEQVGDVLFPSFARLDAERRKAALVRSMKLLALIVFPLAVGLGAVAPTLVDVLFDEKWQAVAPMLVLLSALSITRPISWTVSSYLKARDLPGVILALEVLALVALLGTIATLGRISPLWTCGAVGVAFGLHMLGSLAMVRRYDGIPMRRMLGTLVAPVVACLAMAAAVVALRQGLTSWSPVPSLIAQILVGAVTYIVAALILARDTAGELLRRVADAIQRRPARG